MILDIAEDGVAQSMHHDNFNLSCLGKMEVTRASEIKFNASTQAWDIWLIDGPETWASPQSLGFGGYDEARKAEVHWLSQSRLKGVDPTSEEGIAILQGYRASWEV